MLRCTVQKSGIGLVVRNRLEPRYRALGTAIFCEGKVYHLLTKKMHSVAYLLVMTALNVESIHSPTPLL